MGNKKIILGDHTTSPEDFIAALWGDEPTSKTPSDDQPKTRTVKRKDRLYTKKRVIKENGE